MVQLRHADFRIFNNRMKHWIILILIAVGTCGLAQPTFQLYISKNDSTSTYFTDQSITEGVDGDIYALGTVSTINAFSKCRLIRISPMGEIIWDTTYSHTPREEFSPEIMPHQDGGVILASDSYSYPLQDNDTVADILVWKIDKNGAIQWERVLSTFDFFGYEHNQRWWIYICRNDPRSILFSKDKILLYIKLIHLGMSFGRLN